MRIELLVEMKSAASVLFPKIVSISAITNCYVVAEVADPRLTLHASSLREFPVIIVWR
jgi:hypothetical protein